MTKLPQAFYHSVAVKSHQLTLWNIPDLSTVLESIYEISLMFLLTDQNSFIGRSPYSLRRHSLLCSKAHGCFR